MPYETLHPATRPCDRKRRLSMASVQGVILEVSPLTIISGWIFATNPEIESVLGSQAVEVRGGALRKINVVYAQLGSLWERTDVLYERGRI